MATIVGERAELIRQRDGARLSDPGPRELEQGLDLEQRIIEQRS